MPIKVDEFGREVGVFAVAPEDGQPIFADRFFDNDAAPIGIEAVNADAIGFQEVSHFADDGFEDLSEVEGTANAESHAPQQPIFFEDGLTVGWT